MNNLQSSDTSFVINRIQLFICIFISYQYIRTENTPIHFFLSMYIATKQLLLHISLKEPFLMKRFDGQREIIQKMQMNSWSKGDNSKNANEQFKIIRSILCHQMNEQTIIKVKASISQINLKPLKQNKQLCFYFLSIYQYTKQIIPRCLLSLRWSKAKVK